MFSITNVIKSTGKCIIFGEGFKPEFCQKKYEMVKHHMFFIYITKRTENSQIFVALPSKNLVSRTSDMHRKGRF